MAQVEESGQQRSANVELNLVPFIDLMCVCITFLLITAVWAQVSMIQLGTSIYGKRDETQAQPPPLSPTETLPFRVDVKKNGFILNIGTQVIKINQLSGKYDELSLDEELKKIRAEHADKKDVVISVEDSLPYEFMVLAMDHLIAAGFSNIGIATGVPR